MIEETKAAKRGSSQPSSLESSVWKKSSPWKGCAVFSMRPYMCTPQAVQAWRWIGAFSSTTFSLLPLAVTLTLSRLMTPMTENVAPAGFQHLVQPQAWLKATLPPIFTVTGLLVHLQLSVPPPKFAAPFLTPLSTDGWILVAMVIVPHHLGL